MAHATHNPSSNKQDQARTGPNAGRGDHSAGSAGMARQGRDGQSRQSGAGMRSSATNEERIADVMTRDVRVVRPDQSIREAAVMMADCDIGSLPVGEDDRLVGMITDRDIVLRAVAEGRDAEQTSVREVMTDRIQYCYDDENVEEVAQHMADLGIRRLPVISREKRLVGIIALSNMTQCTDGEAKTAFLDSVAAPH
jgi:CBS domain-containing protein